MRLSASRSLLPSLFKTRTMRWRRDDVLDVRPGEPVGHEQVLRRDRKRSTRRFIVVLNVRFVERKSAIRLLFDKQRSADKLTAAEKPCRTDAVRIALGTHRNGNRVARLHRRSVRGVDRDRRVFSRDASCVFRLTRQFERDRPPWANRHPSCLLIPVHDARWQD